MLLVWFLVNLIQANYTEILSDEAYYGLYGKYLAWGYFDHPPMVAVLIKISSLFFKGNLGIRFATVVLQLFTLLFIWKIIDDRQPDRDRVFSFFIIAASICLFSAYGFFTTPDGPLLFFTAFFLYSYKRFLVEQTWENVLLLALSMAGLIYSKYQAILVIGFVVISNLRLLRRYKFWIAGFCALVLLTPHIWWQVANDYPSLKYHLYDRSNGFRWRYLLEYLPNQMAAFNPLVLGAVVYIMVIIRPKDLFTKALHFMIIGFLGFFWVTAFRGHVEPHWTIACSVPMIVLLYNGSTTNPELLRFLRKVILPSVFIIFIIRILLVTDLPIVKSLGFSGKKEKYVYIESVARDMPVLFLGSFQKPSLYSFFTGKEASAINSLRSRLTQFDLWQFEKKYKNLPVFICGFGEGNSRLYEKNGIEFYGFTADSLQTVNRIQVEITPRLKTIHSGDSVSLTFTLKNRYEYDIDFNNKKFPVEIDMTFIKGGEINFFPVNLREPVRIIRSGETITRTFTTLVPDLPEGKYHFGICLQNLFGPAINNSFSVIKIVNQ
jgi:hypothetical protein